MILGLLFSTEEHVVHFKKWYESGGDHLSFEKDLLLPLMTYYKKYCEEYPEIMGIKLGRGSDS